MDDRFGYRAIIVATVLALYFGGTLVMLDLGELLPAPWSTFYFPCLVAAIPVFILAARRLGIAFVLAVFGRRWKNLASLSLAVVVFLAPIGITEWLSLEIVKMAVASDIANAPLPPGSKKLRWRWEMGPEGDTYLVYDETVPTNTSPTPASTNDACKTSSEALGNHFYVESFRC